MLQHCTAFSSNWHHSHIYAIRHGVNNFALFYATNVLMWKHKSQFSNMGKHMQERSYFNLQKLSDSGKISPTRLEFEPIYLEKNPSIVLH